MILLTHFGEAVDDSSLLADETDHAFPNYWSRSLLSSLFNLNRCINQLGFEVVPVSDCTPSPEVSPGIVPTATKHSG
jgi:hypothetical protein